jgi:hypothetical protein
MQSMSVVRDDAVNAAIFRPRLRLAKSRRRLSDPVRQDAELLQLVTEFLEICEKLAEYNRNTPSSRVFDAALRSANATLERLATLPAKTVEGWMGKARAINASIRLFAPSLESDEPLVHSLLCDMTGPACEEEKRTEVKLLGAATDHAAVSAEIRRLEAAGVKCDEAFALLDKRRFGARARATALAASTPAAIRVKAEIFLGEIDFCPGREHDSLDDLAISLARDLVNDPSGGFSADMDAELIGLCDRLSEIDAEQRRVFDTFEDEIEQGKMNAASEEEWDEILARVCRIGPPLTREGAASMARAANANANRSSAGTPLAADLGEFLALSVCAYLANTAPPVARFITETD